MRRALGADGIEAAGSSPVAVPGEDVAPEVDHEPDPEDLN